MSVDGKYRISTSTPLGKMEIKLTLQTDGDSLSGSASSTMMGSAEFSGGRVYGNRFEFEVEMKSIMGRINMKNTGSVEGDTITGTVETSMGNISYSGVRV